MKKKIKDIASVQSGVFLKGNLDGDVLYLQVKDFDNTGGVYDNVKPTIKEDSKITKHVLTDGDLLFAAKGTTNFCAIYKESIGKAVASTSFLVIKIKSKSFVSPEFIKWFFNHPKTLDFLSSNSVGSSIPSITKTMIEDMELNIPSIEKQNLILEIAFLQKQEDRVRTLIAQKRTKLTNELLINIVK